MSRQVNIAINTTLNSLAISDSDTTTGEVFLDYNGKIGTPVNIERLSSTVALTDADAAIRMLTRDGESGFFTFADILDVTVDAVSIGAADLADVLTGIGAYLFTSTSGGASSTITFNYASGNQYKSFHRVGATASATAVATTNVASYTVYQNGALITPLTFPLTLTQGDKLYVSIVPTNAALAASIELTADGIANPVAFNSLSYYYPRTMSFKENAVELADMMLHTDQALKGTANLGSGLGNCIYGDPVAGEWDMIYVPAQWNYTGRFNIGMNDRSTSDTTANRYSRVRYCISLFTNSIEIFEFNVNKASVGVANNNMMHMMIRSRLTAPGVYTVTYHYSSDNQASWVLLYTSLSTHDGTVNFYPDLMPQTAYFAEIKPPILKKP
jgi:hypothetical protein